MEKYLGILLKCLLLLLYSLLCSATRYLENGGDMYALQQILGHTSLEMVKKYVHSTTRKIVPKFPEFSPLDNLLHA